MCSNCYVCVVVVCSLRCFFFFASDVANFLYFYTHSTANVCQIKFVAVDFSIFASENMGLHARFIVQHWQLVYRERVWEQESKKEEAHTHVCVTFFSFIVFAAKKLWKTHAYIDARRLANGSNELKIKQQQHLCPHFYCNEFFMQNLMTVCMLHHAYTHCV